jgi:hypothetical protein
LTDSIRQPLDSRHEKRPYSHSSSRPPRPAFASRATTPLRERGKLNHSKSNIPAATSHNNTAVYAQSGDEVTITGAGVDGAGKAVHQVWTGKFDAKEYATKGSPSHDMRAYTKVDANTLTYTLMKDGKRLGNGKVVVAADGRSRTVAETMPGANGKPVTTTSVFD